MNIELKDLPAKLTALLEKMQQYTVLLFAIGVVSLFSFLVLQINNSTQVEPDDDLFTERLQSVQRPKVDQNSLERIQQLEDQNIEVQSLFEQARENPFSE